MKIYNFFGGIFLFATIWMYGCYKLSLYYEMNKKEIVIPDDTYERMIISRIRTMDGRKFEEFIAFVFSLNNFMVKLTPATRDGGKDLILNGSTYVECKCYKKDNLISSPMINKLLGSCASDGIRYAIFITTSDYSKDCFDMLDRVNKNMSLKLWNIYDVVDLCMGGDKEVVLKWLGYSTSQFKCA